MVIVLSDNIRAVFRSSRPQNSSQGSSERLESESEVENHKILQENFKQHINTIVEQCCFVMIYLLYIYIYNNNNNIYIYVYLEKLSVQSAASKTIIPAGLLYGINHYIYIYIYLKQNIYIYIMVESVKQPCWDNSVA